MTTIIILCIAAIFALLLLMAALMKKNYTITSTIVINQPQTEVFNYISHIKNQEKYSKWVMADPNVKLHYSGTDATVGFVSSWQSELKSVGVGAQEIIKILPANGYEVEICFEKPFKGISHAEVTTVPLSSEQTKVTTTFKTSMPFPINIMIPFVSKMLLRDMEETATNLKKILEE